MLERLLRDRLFRIGVALLLLGSGPLILILIAAALGLTSDPNPNPVVFGMLAMLTFWPSLLLIGVGLWRASKGASQASE